MESLSDDENGEKLFSPMKAKSYDKINHLQDRIHQLTVEISELENIIKSKKNCMENCEQATNFIKGNGLNETDKSEEDAYVFENALELNEMDRRRISMELHDTVVQNITSLIHKTEFCTKMMDIDVIRCKMELVAIRNILKTTINDLRNTIFNLHPMSLDDLNISASIRLLIDRNSSLYENITFHYATDGEEVEIDALNAYAIFRVVQEACKNAIKHSQAKNITVKVLFSPKLLRILITDDGIGFNFDDYFNSHSCNHFGLLIMKDQAKLLGGKLSFNSELNKGTEICFEIPLENGGND